MSTNAAFQGSIFVNDFRCEPVVETPDWQSIDDAALGVLETVLFGDQP